MLGIIFKNIIKELEKKGFKLEKKEIKVDTRLPDEYFVYAEKNKYYLRFDICNWNKDETYGKKSISYTKSEANGKKYYFFSICLDYSHKDLVKILNGEIK